MAVIPKSNINLATNIGQVLNSAGGSVNQNQPLTFFQSAAKINPWSKRKPVPLTADFCQDISTSEPNYKANWWKGNNGNCGLSIPSYSNMDAVEAAINGGMNGWVHQLPSGGQFEPYRLGDFRGYDTDAKPPFKSFYMPSKVSNLSGTTVVASFSYNPVSQDGASLALGDFSTLSSCYLGVKMYNPTSGRSLWNTMSTTLANSGALEVTLSVAGLPISNGWVAFPFLSSAPQLQGEALQSATYYSIPMIGKASLDIVSSLDSIKITARYSYYSGSNLIEKVQFKFSYTNGSGGSTSNNYVYLTEEGGENPKANVEGEYMTQLPNFSVGLNQTYNYPYDYNGSEWAEISSFNFNANIVNWLSIGIGNGRFVRSTNLIQIAPQ